MNVIANCLVIAGEKSGEDHVLSFLNGLSSKLPSLELWGVGGDALQNQGMELLYHLKDFSSWGVSEVIGKIPFYRKALNKIIAEVDKRNCKVAILVDFQSFNMRLAKELKKRDIVVLYYVAPQAWAWKSYRVKSLAKNVNTLFTIIPFEKKWFSERGLKQVISVEHPVSVKYKNELVLMPKNETKKFDDGLKILLLPGSRAFEVQTLLPRFIDACRILKKQGHKLEVALVPAENINPTLWGPFLEQVDKTFTEQELVEAFNWADFSYAASGTITLMSAFFNVPTVVAYDGSLLNRYIFETFISYSGFVSLANIVAQKSLFPELLIEQASSYNMAKEIKRWLADNTYYQQTIDDLKEVKNLLKGEVPNVGELIAERIAKVYDITLDK